MSNISALTIATIQFNRYTPIPIFILGLVGNIFNILIFTRRSLFKNPCTVYFLSATCVNINVLFFGLLVRSLMDGFNIDVISNSLVLCRLRYIFFHPSSVLSSCFLVLASIDRFCISSQSIRLRKFSHLAIAPGLETGCPARWTGPARPGPARPNEIFGRAWRAFGIKLLGRAGHHFCRADPARTIFFIF